MAEDEVDPKLLDDLNERADEQDAELPEDIDVPIGVSEDDAIKAVQQQFKDAGTECTDDEARKLVHAAWEKSDKKKSDKKSDKDSDEKSDDSDEKSDKKKSDKKSDDSDEDSEEKSDDDSDQ
jgi:hypothetical protein